MLGDHIKYFKVKLTILTFPLLKNLKPKQITHINESPKQKHEQTSITTFFPIQQIFKIHKIILTNSY